MVRSSGLQMLIWQMYTLFLQKTNKGMTAFIVERTCEGVSIGLEEKKWGLKALQQRLLF